MSDETPVNVPYARRKLKAQIGDGPDARGELTFEIVTPLAGEDAGTLDESFADLALEVDRQAALLRNTLGLPEVEMGDDLNIEVDP
ncbi:MAG: hypothetical protein R3324_00155 [Halobacteriales archaeon]|nr:hypothetical protein [Halobacteriales archaeon]